METYPSSTILHVFLKGLTLLLPSRRGIQADNDAVFLEALVGVFFHGCGHVHDPPFSVCEMMEEIYGLLVKLHMSLLGSWLPEHQSLEAWRTGIIGSILSFVLCLKGSAEACCRH